MLDRDIYQVVYKYISYESKYDFIEMKRYIKNNNTSFQNLESQYHRIIKMLNFTGILTYEKEGECTDYRNSGIKFINESDEYMFQDFDINKIHKYILDKMWLSKNHSYDRTFKMKIVDIHDDKLIIEAAIRTYSTDRPCVISEQEATDEDYSCDYIYIYKKQDRSDLVNINKYHNQTIYEPVFGYDYFDDNDRDLDVNITSRICIHTHDQNFKQAIIKKIIQYVTFTLVHDSN